MHGTSHRRYVPSGPCSAMHRPHIHVLLDDPSMTPSVRGALQDLGAEVEVSAVDNSTTGLAAASAPFPTAIRHHGVHTSPAAGTRLAGFGDAQSELLALQLEVDLLRHREAAQRADIRRLDDELRLAASLQCDLHASLPAAKDVDIHVLYRPADVISGDTYDVTRLDESHIAITVADATGHGLPAGLLSVFVKRSLCGKELTGDGYRLLDPDEVLARANADILGTELQECQFVTALYAVYDETTRILTWARAGAPYPILVRAGEPPQHLFSDGPLLGVLPHAPFEMVELRLKPGDTVLFHTDGLETLLTAQGRGMGHRRLDQTEWFQTLGDDPVAAHFHQAEGVLDAGEQPEHTRDDVTAVALHVRDHAVTERPGARSGSAPASAPASR